MKIKRAAALGLVLVFCLGACGKNESTVEDTVEPDITIEESEAVSVETEAEPEEVETEEPKEEVPVIYEDNELINLYLNRYNEANPEAPIERENFEIYHHHGSDHKDQILFNNGVVISAQTGSKVKIDIEGGDTQEAYKQAFIQYARGYNTELSPEVLEEYWEQSMSNLNLDTQFDDFVVYIHSYNDSIELLEISGAVE